MKARLLILWIHCLLLSVGARAQFGSDLGPTAISTLAWNHISSMSETPTTASSIGLTSDKKVYVWGTNHSFTIHTKKDTQTPGAPIWQMTPHLVPGPAGETIKKVRVKGNDVGGSYIPTFFSLSESGKLYAWGINTGLLGTAWVNNGNTALPANGDTTKTIRIPKQLTILTESSFVDFDVSRRDNYWIAIGTSGKAYHIGNNGAIPGGTIDTQLTFAAMPNPSGVDNATFRYTNVWICPYSASSRPFIYLKGNNGKVYFTGSMSNSFGTGVPSLYGFNTPAPTLTTAESLGNVRTIAPREVPFPAGEDIVDIKMTSGNVDPGYTNYALSASGKAYMTGLWRVTGYRVGYDNPFTFTVAPLKVAPILNTELHHRLVGSGNIDSMYVLKNYVEVAIPPGATKILDIQAVRENAPTFATLVVADDNKVYWSGSNLPAGGSTSNNGSLGNYLSASNSLSSQIDICNTVYKVHTTSFYSWQLEAINYRGAKKIYQTNSSGLNFCIGIISKTGRGYFVGRLYANTGAGKLDRETHESVFPVPIANELLADCNPSPGTGGPLGEPVSTPGVGTIDCSKTQIAPAPVAGTPSQTTLIVSVNVTTVGTFTPITVSGSAMSLGNGITSVSTTTTGVQTFYIPLQYDGTALTNAFQFTVGSAGSCTADLTQKPNQQVTNVWSLTNCSAILPGTLSK